MPVKEWTKKEIVLWGLGMCGGTKGFVDTETVGVFLFERHPGIFGLKSHPQYPDIDVARVQLADAKRDKGADDPVRVIQDTDDRKRRARQRGDDKRVLSRDPMWKLNDEGIHWYNENREAIQRYIDSVTKLGERRGRGSIRVSAKQISAAVIERIRRRPSFAKFTRDLEATYTEEDLPILDFFEVFNIDAHTPENLFQSARTRTLAAVETDSVEDKYVIELSRLYEHRYRSYYDELLAQGG
ncbi:MAG TPA: hypothetical protein DDX89_06470 [Candidatus Omnitrophica bacterium]|nr:MAG: hypothetical protein A2Z92_01415 [Omnitrophica WOR_2 bacterium GWA2_63_20]OGX19001.1 MAG: hypothetical protein A2105_03835 [Omnitrophica WOR_2 bacterium GWF2_63_9]OGX30802.1 MAG: hypothetical protein A3E56_02975 [Omnitrophica WOR_2 bacterium RIFCSPHIGHO2_12_FULL_64_13]OGX36064.1 MAG: hypothetical protein A3B73_04165 [Omnitrophica WOR_2 bacterium RIFCSPHIGHO2_02_FULL_63_39]OGX44121.1 MAG: hypothetical protein A3I71_05625 [Omnitrophica WOR_2 bacterium RIFCSPLOWO2_02_FULL_63_16]OGX49028.1